MKMKKYLVRDLSEAMRMIKDDLGEDAVILSTKKIKKGGFFGIGAKTYFEVTAVVEEKEKKEKSPEKSTKNERYWGENEIYKLQEILRMNRRNLESAQTQPSNQQDLQREMNKIKEMLYDLKMSLLSNKSENLPKGLDRLVNALKFHEIEPELVSKITEFFRMNYQEIDLESSEIETRLVDFMRPFIKTDAPEIRGKIIFVGPTGVGKTTTLAKIAAKLSFEKKLRTAILTFDTYRIAAAEQLKTYASIMDIPIRVAYTPQEARMELNAMIDYDVVLMDTAGRNQKNDIQMGELKAIVDSVTPNYVFLVISLTSKYADACEIVEKFKIVNPTHVILTKLDETNTFGHFLNIPYKFGVPVAFITNGQRVPEDIFEANSVELARMLVKEVLRYARSS